MKKVKLNLIDILKVIFYPFIWFAGSFQGTDGKASGKKFTAGFLTVLTGLYSTHVHDSYTLYAFIALLVTILMMWGIITSSNIITFTRTLKATKGGEGKNV
jgi:hypothetical protein